MVDKYLSLVLKEIIDITALNIRNQCSTLKKYHNIEFCANNRPKSVNNIAVRVLTCNSVGLCICMTTSMMSLT